MMSNNRDIQFQGFAKLLLKELIEFECVYTDRGWFKKNEDEDRELIIARRAYDFACYLLKNGDPMFLDTGGYYYIDDEEAQHRVNNLPDMTELPEECYNEKNLEGTE